MKRTLLVVLVLAGGLTLFFIVSANIFPDWTWKILNPAWSAADRLHAAASAYAQISQSDLEQKSEKIQALLRTGKFNEAEPLARECVQQLPEEIYFLGQLEMVLNGQGKFREADELRDKIRKVWERDYKAKWIAKGSPVGESSWARVVGSSKEYDVFGAEYFVPRLLEGSDRKHGLVAFYKVIAFPKTADGASRIFQLNKSANEKHYFLEEFSDKAISMAKMYGNELPDIRAVVADAIGYLDSKNKKQAEFRPQAYGTHSPRR
jgi:hypothetical protein